jgi:hypothetical protein
LHSPSTFFRAKIVFFLFIVVMKILRINNISAAIVFFFACGESHKCE